jgi:putative hemin transport protein
MSTNTNTNLNGETPEALRAAWAALQAQDPRLYTRDAARKLGVSEAYLIALGCGDGTSRRLHVPDYAALLRPLADFGTMLALVRNEDAVLERDCVPAFTQTAHGLTTNADGVLLAVNANAIAHAFVVHSSKFLKRGIQFFDSTGTAIFKLYLRAESKLAAFDEWISPWIAADQSSAFTAVPTPARSEADEKKCCRVGHRGEHGGHVAGHAHASADGHCCHAHSHSHAHAHGAVRYATEAPIELPAESYKELLSAVIKSGEALTVGVANAHAFFSVTAPVKKVAPMGPWFNILDAELHLHLSIPAVQGALGFIGADATGTGTLKVLFKRETGENIAWFRVAGDGYAAAQVLASAGK